MEHRSFAPDIVVPNDDYACGNKRVGELAPDVAPEELRQEKQVGGPVNCSDSELCTFLQALEAGFLPTFYSGISQCAQSNGMSIASKSYRKGKKTVYFHGFQSLTMYKNSTENHGEALLTWFRGDFLARTYRAQGKELESKASAPACGSTWHELSVKYDLDSHSWKTVHCLFPEDLPWSSVTLPRSGMTVGGRAYQLPSLGLITRGTESGSLLPTPTCHNAKEGAYPAEYTRKTPTLATHVGGKIHPNFTEWMMAWPQGWTDLRPLGTDKFRQWLQLHGGYCQDE
jgi:hypothetical protein